MPNSTHGSVIFCIALICFISIGGVFFTELGDRYNKKVVKKVQANAQSTPTPTPTIAVDPEDPIVKDIREVFGKHSDKALLLLTCENARHNVRAENHNSDEVGSTDYGLFQINDYWQGIRHQGKAMQFLFDPKINTRIAWRLYEDNGYSFRLWTCGRKLGI